jgi:SpoVK/Ycf46/Vps4 family AAA+-type ATPase
MRTRRKLEKTEKYTQFITKDGLYQPIGNPTLLPGLPPNIYTVNVNMAGEISFVVKDVLTSKYIDLPTMVTASIISDIETFWKKETKSKFDKFGLVYKRGSIMHGEPGTGKTCTVFKVISSVVDMGGIAIYNPDPHAFSEAVKILHSIQGETPIVCVFEEFDRYCKGSDFLSLLDGDLQVPSIYYLATTNHLDRIPNSIKNRPSRFAKVIEVGKPDDSAREAYIKSFFQDISNIDLKLWIKSTDGMVLDQIKDMIIGVECFGETLDSSKRKAATTAPEEKDSYGIGLEDDSFNDYDRN